MFKLNGAQVNASHDESNGKISFTPGEDLTSGSHTVTIDVKDYAQNPATQAAWSFTVDVQIPGDINGDTNVTLTDAILAIQVMAGMSPAEIRSDYVTSGADVNGDNKIGLAEVIYILQHVAGLR